MINKNSKSQGIVKVQIMEEPLSDEVSPGVTLTTSAKISPTSETKKSAETSPKMKGEKTKTSIISRKIHR